MEKHPFEALDFTAMPEQEMREAARTFYERIRRRRSVRAFSDQPVPREIIENALRAAGSAPSGANMQPWHYVAVSDPGLKRRIRLAAEKEERALYEHRASEEWLKALEPLGTDARKPFLEIAPWLIAVFLQKFTIDDEGVRHKHYYTAESVGISVGFLLAALHWSGLATLTHTPSPMGFLGDVLQRPEHERAYVLIVAGYPAAGAKVPAIGRKPLEQIASFLE